MASIDRYRPPPRETYQIPAAPPSHDNPIKSASKSPSRKREIPPPAPSPPTNSSRTSPPRPQSRRSMPSPSRSTPPTPVATTNQWFFTQDEVLSSPSILDGLSPAEERLRRAKGVNFIYQAGILLELPQTTLYVAGVFFHRFFMRSSMVEEKHGIHHYNIAATALFLANKTEENCRKTKDIIIAVAKVAQKNAKLVVDEQSKEYWRWRDSILMFEEIMLENLTFDLMVDSPHFKLYDFLGRLGVIHNKNLRHAAWAFCNDSCLTALPLLMDARDIAIASIFFSSTFTGEQIEDVDGDPWWQTIGGNEDHCARAIQVLAEFYVENPLRKQDNPYSQSPVFILENTRRRGEDIGVRSANGTPRTDSATQSPKGKTNGTDEAAADREMMDTTGTIYR
ncbi:cyclin-like protein [Durotheca rogersii]|uniref:cyclin-like protein n=1 Tax=Durotheca rogersii TaxID=419775 RepID=UPI00222059EF|nr:cyclin-like protein [Durotheca rogersii]KAI5862585.1 cyclin-like protein [Durotheca rogersii]